MRAPSLPTVSPLGARWVTKGGVTLSGCAKEGQSPGLGSKRSYLYPSATVSSTVAGVFVAGLPWASANVNGWFKNVVSVGFFPPLANQLSQRRSMLE